MKYYKKLVGEKVYLSPLCLEDAPKLTLWMNNMENNHGLGNSSNIYSLEGEQQFIKSHVESTKPTFAIVDLETDELLGICSFNKVDHINRSGIIGIFIGEAKGKGYGTDALKQLTRFGFNYLNLHTIELGVYSFNKNAIRCYEKVGFKTCGTRHDAVFVNGEYHDVITMELINNKL